MIEMANQANQNQNCIDSKIKKLNHMISKSG